MGLRQYKIADFSKASLFKGRIRGGIALIMVALILCVGEEFIRQPVHYQVWGYYPEWLKDEWQKVDLGLFDQILFFDVPVSADGRMLQVSDWPKKWQNLIVAAKGTRLQPVFTLFDGKEFERIFSDANQRKLLQTGMLALTDPADGLQLDFEIFGAVSGASSDGYRLFLKSMKRELAAKGKKLSLFVLTEDSAGLYDSAALQNADYIVIQGYDAHWKGSPNAGSVAELHGASVDSWDSSLKHYLSLGVPRNKILMSVPYFGYEWSTISDMPGAPTRGAGREISFAPLPAGLVPEVAASARARIGQYGVKRDPATGSPYYIFKNKTGWVQGWFEDEASLSAKFEFVRKERLAGVAVFPLGYDGENFQNLLRRHFRQ